MVHGPPRGGLWGAGGNVQPLVKLGDIPLRRKLGGGLPPPGKIRSTRRECRLHLLALSQEESAGCTF